jgi:hypothetical protein
MTKKEAWELMEKIAMAVSSHCGYSVANDIEMLDEHLRKEANDEENQNKS